MTRKSRRIRKSRECPVARQAKAIGLPAEQHGNLVICDVANHSEADQRASVRSGETKTVRKLTRVELMQKHGVITPDQAAACSWYATAYEMGFHTVGCTANYSGAGGGGFGSSDLLARYKEQSEARADYLYARQAIPAHLIGTFEAVVLGIGRPPHMMPKVDKTRFSLAAFLLHQQIGHMLAIAA